MKCESVIQLLRVADGRNDGEQFHAAERHIESCVHCRHALLAYDALQAERSRAVPPPRAGALDRALRAAERSTDPAAGRRLFWTGMGLGGALAASLALLLASLLAGSDVPPRAGTPEVSLALHEPRPISISLDSPVALGGAEIHVVLTGEIGLDGYAGQRELRWVTNLDRGGNQLTLPVIAQGLNGGQVLVEVLHDGKRRNFVIDVHGAG